MDLTNEVLCEYQGQTAMLRLNRAEKGNALTMPMIEALGAYTDEIARSKDVRAVVIQGTGDRFFCTGGDIEGWGKLTPNDMGRDWILPGIEVFDRIASLPQVVIAALNGHALGGGLELALAADLRVAVKRAKLGTPEVTLGMICGWMGVRRLAETVGVARARHLTLLGAPITAQQALDWGLVTGLAEDGADLAAQVDAWIKRIGDNGPSAMALTKGILATMHADLRHHHASAAAQAAATEDCREGIRAFSEKRSPTYRNV